MSDPTSPADDQTPIKNARVPTNAATDPLEETIRSDSLLVYGHNVGWWRNVLIGLGAIALICLATVLGRVALFLTLGWLYYVPRIVPTVEISIAGLLVCAIGLPTLILGLSRLLQPFLQSRSRPIATKGVFLAGLVAVTAGSLSAIGHQVGWLISSDERLTKSAYAFRTRSISKNNLKQVGLAVHNYSDTYNDSLPTLATFDANGRGLHSWTTQLLPFIDVTAVYRRIDQTQPWDAPVNRAAVTTTLDVLLHPGAPPQSPRQNPSDIGLVYPVSDYAANVHAFDFAPQRSNHTTWRRFTDGTSQTILAGEAVIGRTPWAKPGNWRDPAIGVNVPGSFNSPSRGGCQFLIADGTVRFVSQSTNIDTLKALSTPDGGETVGEF